MADYLRTLAARALGDLPVVRPRQPSRFEPVISADVGPLETIEVDELVAADPPARGESAIRRDAAPPPAPPTEGAPTVSRDDGRKTLEAVQTTRWPAAPPSRVAEPPQASAIVAAVAAAEPVASRKPASKPPALGQTPQLFAAHRPRAAPPIAAPRPPLTPRTQVPALRDTTTPIVETALVSRGDVGPLADAAPMASMSPRVVPSRRDGNEEIGFRRVTGVHQDIEEGIAPLSDGGAPAITVSIGRIEVRASRPESARTVASSPRPRPRLTLDAFLNRQGRGR